MAEGAIAFMGARGANGESAVRALYGRDASALPRPTLRDALAAVIEGSAASAVVPLDNSSAGPINESYDLLVELGLRITAAVELRIRHSLLALRGEAFGSIVRVRSHPQALAQCESFLAKRRIQPIAGPDTATCARELAEQRTEGTGVIAARIAAEIYGLEVLAEELEDRADNRTRFVAVGAPPEIAGPWRTTLIAHLEDRPGALHRLLGPFAAHGINVSRLVTRPDPPGWGCRFHIDLDGAAERPEIAAALAEARSEAREVRLLGSYPVLVPA